jgi:hypothetical protein
MPQVRIPRAHGDCFRASDVTDSGARGYFTQARDRCPIDDQGTGPSRRTATKS